MINLKLKKILNDKIKKKINKKKILNKVFFVFISTMKYYNINCV
jgi:hypothetical protein